MLTSKNFLNFNSAVHQFLKCILLKNEQLIEELFNDRLIFKTPFGISYLDIKPNSALVTVYFENVYDINEKELFEINNSLENVTFIVNGNYLDKFKEKLSIIDITKHEEWVNPKEDIRFLNDSFTTKNFLNIDLLQRYINFYIRIDVVACFKKYVDPFNIFDFLDNDKPIFPFIYKTEEKSFIFYEDFRQVRNVNFENYDLVKVTTHEYDGHLYVRFATDKYYFDDLKVDFMKIDLQNFNKHLETFNLCKKFSVSDFGRLYKYRQFEKTRYSTKEENVILNPLKTAHPDSLKLCVGARTAIENGTIWFSDYKSLNDPFDLDFRYPNSITSYHGEFEEIIKGDSFKILHDNGVCVFCTTEKSDNILMWSHYGCSHMGICSEYSKDKILLNISNDSSVGLCFYGRVKYSNQREKFKITKSMLRFMSFDLAVLLFNVKNLFTKYIDWSYEKEYRFVLFPNKGSVDNYIKSHGHGLTLKSSNYYISENFPSRFNGYLGYFHIKPFKYSLDDKEYKLK